MDHCRRWSKAPCGLVRRESGAVLCFVVSRSVSVLSVCLSVSERVGERAGGRGATLDAL